MKKIVATAFFLILPLILLAPMNAVSASCSLIEATNCPGGQWLCATYRRPGVGRSNPGGTTRVYCCTNQNECTSAPSDPGSQVTTPAAPELSTQDSPCQYVTDQQKLQDCLSCTGVWTAIGCIKTDPNNMLGSILGLGIGVAGGIAFLLILFGGLQIMTSAGNPEQMNAGRELISSAITGLLLIIFAVFLLQFIGINIIGVPGFISK